MAAHNASIHHPADFEWTQFNTIGGVLSRSQPLTINWTGGRPGAIVVILGSSPASLNSGAQFYCLADAAAGSFTVPASILSALPPTFIEPFSMLGFGSLAVEQIIYQPINIPGTDQAAISAIDVFGVAPIRYE